MSRISTILMRYSFNSTASNVFLIIYCKSAYCVEFWQSYLELYVDQRSELWQIFGSLMVPIFKVTERSRLGSLWRKQKGSLLLDCNLFTRRCILCSYSHYLCSLLPTVHCSTIYTINTTIRICWTCHYAVTVLQYVQCHHLANCTGKPVGLFQRFITVLLATVTLDSVANLIII